MNRLTWDRISVGFASAIMSIISLLFGIAWAWELCEGHTPIVAVSVALVSVFCTLAFAAAAEDLLRG